MPRAWRGVSDLSPADLSFGPKIKVEILVVVRHAKFAEVDVRMTDESWRVPGPGRVGIVRIIDRVSPKNYRRLAVPVAEITVDCDRSNSGCDAIVRVVGRCAAGLKLDKDIFRRWL